MIQAVQPKPIEPKAPERAKVSSNSKVQESHKTSKASSAVKDLEGDLESEDFANELEAAGAADKEVTSTSEAKVKPVQVSEEQALETPSSLINFSQSGNVETTTPKIFDPALTQGVEELIQPSLTQVPVAEEAVVAAVLTDADVLKLAEGEVTGEVKAEMKSEIAQALLKTPQVAEGKAGRAPAIEFAQSEIDPQLMNMEDFVAQKNLAVKKNISAQNGAYGMAKPQQKAALESGLAASQVVKENTALEGSNSSAMNSQQFILNMKQDQAPVMSETAAPAKVFDMSHVKSSNVNEIMNQISDHVMQAKVAKEPTVNMRMTHDELGMIDITVQKSLGVIPGQEAVAINIGAHSLEGKNFFQQNSKDLFSHLTQAGINVSDFKVETPSQTAKSDFDFGQHQSKQSGAEKQFGSEQNQRKHEQDRRQELWKLFNQEAA